MAWQTGVLQKHTLNWCPINTLRAFFTAPVVALLLTHFSNKSINKHIYWLCKLMVVIAIKLQLVVTNALEPSCLKTLQYLRFEVWNSENQMAL